MVELADTPSDAITLAILYNLLILQLLPFTSITSKEPTKEGQYPAVGAGCRQSVQNPVQLADCKTTLPGENLIFILSSAPGKTN